MSTYHVKLLCLAPLASQEGSTRNMPRTWRTNGQTCRAKTHQGHSGVSSNGPTNNKTSDQSPTPLEIPPQPAPRLPRSPLGQQQRWTSITQSLVTTSMQRKKMENDRPHNLCIIKYHREAPQTPLPASMPPRSPPGQQQQWTSIG